MATTKDYLDYVLERLPEPEAARCRKMFGEYMVYLNDRPVLLVCDNTVFVKRLPELADLMKSAPTGVPYSGSKEHYILDMDDIWYRNCRNGTGSSCLFRSRTRV